MTAPIVFSLDITSSDTFEIGPRGPRCFSPGFWALVRHLVSSDVTKEL